jgi:hypothetical protein
MGLSVFLCALRDKKNKPLSTQRIKIKSRAIPYPKNIFTIFLYKKNEYSEMKSSIVFQLNDHHSYLLAFKVFCVDNPASLPNKITKKMFKLQEYAKIQ